MVVLSPRRWDDWHVVFFGSARIVQLVLLRLVSGGQLRSPHALAGAVGEDVVPAGQTVFIQTSYGHLLR